MARHDHFLSVAYTVLNASLRGISGSVVKAHVESGSTVEEQVSKMRWLGGEATNGQGSNCHDVPSP